MAMILEENTMLIAFLDWQWEKKLQRNRQRQTYMSHKYNGIGEPHEDQDYDNFDEEAWECLNQGRVQWNPEQSPQA